MQAGLLNRRITIQSPSATQDEYGQLTPQWDDLIHTWASIRAATSKEVFAASGFTSEVSHIITIRYRPAVTIRSKYRALFNGRVFNIQTVTDPDESKAQLKLLCLEINDGQ